MGLLEISPHLVFNNGVSEGFCKFADSADICFIPLVADSIATVRHLKQVVPDTLESSRTKLTQMFAREGRRILAQIGSHVDSTRRHHPRYPPLLQIYPIVQGWT